MVKEQLSECHGYHGVSRISHTWPPQMMENAFNATDNVEISIDSRVCRYSTQNASSKY